MCFSFLAVNTDLYSITICSFCKSSTLIIYPSCTIFFTPTAHNFIKICGRALCNIKCRFFYFFSITRDSVCIRCCNDIIYFSTIAWIWNCICYSQSYFFSSRSIVSNTYNKVFICSNTCWSSGYGSVTCYIYPIRPWSFWECIRFFSSCNTCSY